MTGQAIKRPGRIDLHLIRWSDSDNEFLTTNYLTMTMAELQNEMQGRTKSSIIQQAGVLGLWGIKNLENAKPWSEAEMDVLRMYYPDGGAEACYALLPCRSRNAVQIKRKRMGIPRVQTDST